MSDRVSGPSQPATLPQDDDRRPQGVAPVLQFFPWMAAFAVIATLFGRALSPAVKGVGMGLGNLIQTVDIAGGVLSFDFVVLAVGTAMVGGLALMTKTVPIVLRVGTVIAGGFALVPTLWALHAPLSDSSAAALGLAVSCFALLSAWSGRNTPFARLPAMTVTLIALGSLTRVGAVVLAIAAPKAAPHGLQIEITSLATTVAFGFDALGVGTAVAWVASRSKRVTSPTTVFVLACALLCTRQALRGGRGDDQHIVDVLLWGAAQRLISSPAGGVPLPLRMFIGFLAPLTAAASLIGEGTFPALGAAVALALVAQGAVEMPPCAWMLALAALTVALVAHFPRVIWESVVRMKAGAEEAP